MSTLTTNYGLVKPALADSPPDITVMNPNWDRIDDELKNHSSQLASIDNITYFNNISIVEYANSITEANTFKKIRIFDGTYVPTGYGASNDFICDINIINTEAGHVWWKVVAYDVRSKRMFILNMKDSVLQAWREVCTEDYRPNLLINGDFQVWQRDTSFTFANASYYTADRWKCGANVDLSINNNNNKMNISNTSTAVGGWMSIVNYVEQKDFIKLLGQSLTISCKGVGFANKSSFFVAKGSDGQWLYSVGITDDTGDSTTFTLDTSLATESSLMFGIYFNPESINSYVIDYVKLELNDHATPIIPRSYGEELAMCQRYYEKSSMAYRGVIGDNLRLSANVPYKTNKRIIPTIRILSTVEYQVGKVRRCNDGVNVGCNVYTNDVDGFGAIDLQTTVSNSEVYEFTWTADAEL